MSKLKKTEDALENLAIILADIEPTIGGPDEEGTLYDKKNHVIRVNIGHKDGIPLTVLVLSNGNSTLNSSLNGSDNYNYRCRGSLSSKQPIRISIEDYKLNQPQDCNLQQQAILKGLLYGHSATTRRAAKTEDNAITFQNLGHFLNTVDSLMSNLQKSPQVAARIERIRVGERSYA